MKGYPQEKMFHMRIKIYLLSNIVIVFLFSYISAEVIKIGLTRLKEGNNFILQSPDGGCIYLDNKIILNSKSEIKLTIKTVFDDLSIVIKERDKTNSYKGKEVRIIPSVFVSIENLEKNVKKYYEGEIVICNKNGILFAINQIEFDKYLSAVVSKEIGIESSIEALKAQAVASRSFAIFNFLKHKKDGFNVCDSRFACCQVYDGTYKAFNQKVYDAVSQTYGEILTYRRRCIDAVFHSCCGGRTCSSVDAWPNTDKKKWLVGIDDIDNSGKAYCKNSPRFKWRNKIPKKVIARCFDLHRHTDKLLLQKNSSNDIIYICMEDKKLTIIDFRRKLARLGYKGVDSNFFKIEEKNNSYIFSGFGFGHRVGMCQNGAKEMARRGFNYCNILKHYYPNVDISNWRTYEKGFYCN